MKRIIEWKLKLFACWVLKKYKPVIIGVTGSVGKTSTKEAIFTVLSSKFRVGKNIGNYNNEIGLPLSILGLESGKKNPFAWLGVFIKALLMLLVTKRDYPEYLVLEMGADKPGDIKYLVSMAPPSISVITAIGQVHTELFGSLDKVIREKQHIITSLKKDNIAVLNTDDSLVVQTQEKTRARVVSFGFSEQAMVRASEVAISAGPSADPWIDQQIKGVSFKLQYKGSTVPVFLPLVLGQHQIYSALAAAAVGIALEMNLSDIAGALGKYQSPPGRMRLLPGIKHTSIIDDSYNSSPMAAKAALSVFDSIKVSGRKFVALGDMLELGSYTEEGHREVGKAVAPIADMLVTVGERAKLIAQAAVEAGLPQEAVFSFADTLPAGKFIQQRLRQGDIILVKGSQGARMERIVKELMAEPLRAKELLVRQSGPWVAK